MKLYFKANFDFYVNVNIRNRLTKNVNDLMCLIYTLNMRSLYQYVNTITY